MQHPVEAALQAADRAGALADPQLSLTAFAAPPETRVGPQRLMASVSQAIPARGKRSLARTVATHRLAALRADYEAEQIALAFHTKRLYFEIAHRDTEKRIQEEFRLHLKQHEEIARGRYGAGFGTAQGVLKLQTELTRVEQRLLAIATERTSLVARLNCTPQP